MIVWEIVRTVFDIFSTPMFTHLIPRPLSCVEGEGHWRVQDYKVFLEWVSALDLTVREKKNYEESQPPTLPVVASSEVT